MPILLLRSKKLKKPLEKFCRISNSASWEIDDYQSQPYPAKLFLWSLGKNLLMVFQPQGLRSDLPFAHDQKHWPSKPSNEWISPFQIVLSGLFFSFSLKFNHVHWLVPSNTYECPYSRRKLSYSTLGPNFFEKWWFKGLALGSLSEVGSGEVDNFHSSRKDFFHWYWPSL